jgi:hypothetical protein
MGVEGSKKQIYFHALGGIQTHDPIIWVVEDSTYLTLCRQSYWW